MGSRSFRFALAWACAWVKVAMGPSGVVAGLVAVAIGLMILSSVPPAVVVGLTGAITFGRVVPLAGHRGGPVRGRLLHAAFPAALLTGFVFASLAFGAGWLAAAIGLAAGAGVDAFLRSAWLPEVALDDVIAVRRELERRTTDQELARSLGRKAVTAPSRPRLRV